MAVINAPSKTLYAIKQGFWHKGVFAAAGANIALTDAEAKYLRPGGNISLPPYDFSTPAPEAAPEAAPAPAQA